MKTLNINEPGDVLEGSGGTIIAIAIIDIALLGRCLEESRRLHDFLCIFRVMLEHVPSGLFF